MAVPNPHRRTLGSFPRAALGPGPMTQPADTPVCTSRWHAKGSLGPCEAIFLVGMVETVGSWRYWAGHLLWVEGW